MLSRKEGSHLVHVARHALTSYLENKPINRSHLGMPPSFLDERGAFVTLYTHPKKQLRGCIGRIDSSKTRNTLMENVIESAIDAGTSDPRFESINNPKKLGNITFEVTVLSKPKPIHADSYNDRKKQIKIGRDGLILQHTSGRSAIFLPQVPVEQRWDVDTYYAKLCAKANIPLTTCKDTTQTQALTFYGEIFAEQLPNGATYKKEMH